MFPGRTGATTNGPGDPFYFPENRGGDVDVTTTNFQGSPRTRVGQTFLSALAPMLDPPAYSPSSPVISKKSSSSD